MDRTGSGFCLLFLFVGGGRFFGRETGEMNCCLGTGQGGGGNMWS